MPRGRVTGADPATRHERKAPVFCRISAPFADQNHMRIRHWIPRGLRWGATALAALSVALTVLSFFAAYADFGTEAYALAPDGRLMVYLPFQWARNEYCETFPFDADSLLGVVEYWFPRRLSVQWRPWSGYSLDPQWWIHWLHPLDFSTDGEYSETGARPIPLPLLVYATLPPAAAAWLFPAWRRARSRRVRCRCAGGAPVSNVV